MEKGSRLKYFPISFFATVMGLSGLTLAWQKAETLFELPFRVSPYILGMTALVFMIIFLIYTVKMFRHHDALMAELHHPIKLNFFPAVTISLILLGICTLQVSPDLSKILWVSGAALHLILTFYVINTWINHQYFKIEHVNPAWFIPLVGNIMVPVGGVPNGYPEISWFFFSIGLLFWIVLLTINFYRLIFHHPLPTKLVPTFFILIAPPSLGFISYYTLVGQVDAFARVLFYSGLFFALLLATRVVHFTKINFSLPMWAFSFPMAAITVSTMMMYHVLGGEWYKAMSYALLTILTLVLIFLVIRTIIGIFRGEICVKED